MKRLGIGVTLLVALAAAAVFATASSASSKASNGVPYNQRPFGLKCTTPGQSYLCTDVADMTVDPDNPTGQVNIGGVGYQGDDNAYVGHDEPSQIFYSNAAGSGNNVTWQMTLPKQAPTFPSQAGAGSPSWDFELHPAFWFGMAMCDTTSYPNYKQTCTPDSDSNIADGNNPSSPDFMGHHSGGAYMEMQFYPPGWAPWFDAISCDPTRWCAALNIDSFIEQDNPFQLSNPACAGIAGVEPFNFQYLSLGTSGNNVNGPANPWDATVGTYVPNSSNLFMNSGDRLQVHLFDTPAGFKVQVNDLTTGQVGAAVASGANGFAHAPYDPAAGYLQPGAVQLPPDVRDLERAHAAPVDRAQLQRRLLGRDRALRALQPGRERQLLQSVRAVHRQRGRLRRRSRADGRGRQQLRRGGTLAPGADLGLHRPEHGLRRDVVCLRCLAGNRACR